MPVDVSPINTIIQAYQTGVARRQQAEQFKQEQELKRQQLEQEAELQKQNLERQALAQKATQKYQEADLALKKATLGQNIQQQTLQSGVTPAGYEVKNINPDFFGESANITYQNPLTGEQFTVPDTRSYFQQQAENQRIALQPQTEAKQIIEAAKQQAEQIRQEAIKNKDLERAVALEGYKAQLQSLKSAEDYKRAIDVAKIKAAASSASKAIPAADLDVAVQGLANGTYTVEDLPRLGIPAASRLNVLKSLRDQGIAPLKKEQVGKIQEISSVFDLYKKARQLADAVAPTNTSPAASLFQGAKHKLDPGIRALEDELTGKLGQVARVISGEKGMLSNKDIERSRGLFPSIYQTNEVNQRRLKEFQAAIKDRIDKLTTNMSSAQREQILKQYGIDTETSAAPKIKVYNPDTGKFEDQ